MNTRKNSQSRVTTAKTVKTVIGPAPYWTPERRGRLLKLSKVLSIIMIVAMAFTLQIMLILAEDDVKEGEHPPEVDRIEKLALTIERYDRDGDSRLSPEEIAADSSLAGKARLMDHNRDGALDMSDVASAFRAFKQKDMKADPTQADWIKMGGSAVAFGIADRDGDGRLREIDFIVANTASGSSDLIMVRDSRTGRELLLDPLRIAWLETFMDRHKRGVLRWDRVDIQKADFGLGSFGTLTTPAGDTYRGFIRYPKNSDIVVVLNAKKEERSFPKAEVTIETEANAPEAVWFSEMDRLKADDAEGWKDLAIRLSAERSMRAAARDCARRALIYDAKLDSVYGIAEVQLVQGVFKHEQGD